jgi:DNA recombination protein RmuC
MLFIYILLAIIILLVLVIIIKQRSTNNTIEYTPLTELIKEKINNLLIDNNYKLTNQINQLDKNILKQLADNNESLINKFNNLATTISSNLTQEVGKLNDVVRLELDRINSKVEEKLTQGFENSKKTFDNVLERLTRIDEAQKKIEKLSTEVVSLQDILTDKKTRGTFGEVQLNQILITIFGETQKIYKLQYTLTNKNRADAILFLPNQNPIVIDSKFPLENYNRMIAIDNSEEQRKSAGREFEINVKKMIDDIATKYIVPNETSEQAIMFIPAEAIFAQINAYHSKLIDHAQQRKVWLASPTTLMALLTTMQVVIKNIEQEKHAKIIQQELTLLSKEFDRYKDRWGKLSNHINAVVKDIEEINTTTNKISNKFDNIAKVELNLNDNKLPE